MSRLPTHNGHFYNWYDNTRYSLVAAVLSTVDNGNFVCCLWTLKGACAELKSESLSKPIWLKGSPRNSTPSKWAAGRLPRPLIQ